MAPNKADKYAKLKQFIWTYRDLPTLWNTKSKEYFDKAKKIDAYDTLLKIYQEIEADATVEDVKKKINVLRTNYRREIKKKLYIESIGQTFYPSWAFHEFKFLDDYYEQVNKSVTTLSPKMKDEFIWELKYDNKNNTTAYTEPPKAEIHGIEDEEPDEQEEEDEDEDIPQTIIHSSNPAKKFKLSRTYEQLQPHDYLRLEETEESITAKNWSNKLARMKPDQKIWAEKFINDILTEGELGTLHRHFLTVSPTTSQVEGIE